MTTPHEKVSQLSTNSLLTVLGLLAAGCTSAPDRAPELARDVPPAPAPVVGGRALAVEPPAARLPAEEAHEEGEAEHGPHAVSVLAAGTLEGGSRNGFAIGADYSYAFTKKWEGGAFAEFVTGANRALALGVVAIYVPVEDFKLIAGPGMEKTEHEWGPIFRIGALYDLELADQWTIAPTVYYDITENENLFIWGASLTYHF